MIFCSMLFNIRRILIDQKQIPRTNATDVTKKTHGSDAYYDDGLDNGKSSMNSNNIITAKRKHITQSKGQLSTQIACNFQITYYKLTNGRHKTTLKIMMANSIYEKTRS